MFGSKDTKRIYVDYAAATPVREEVRSAMDAVIDRYGNPGSLHQEGVAAARVLDTARSDIAKTLAVKSTEILFTSGGTESNNLAILGCIRAREQTGVSVSHMHILTSTIEHPSVLETIRSLEARGVAVTYVAPDEQGVVRPESVSAALTSATVLVSIGWANSEIGVIQPLRMITAAVRGYEKEHSVDITVHTDAGQAPLYLPPIPHGLGVDMMTLDGGKLYGPRGVGALYVRRDTALAPLFFGGAHEQERRPGTENVVGATGLSVALALAAREGSEEAHRQSVLRDFFITTAMKEIDGTILNGDKKKRLPNNINISIPDIDSEYIIMALDHKGVAASTKSACLERKEIGESPVVQALGGEAWRALNTLRFSLGKDTTKDDVDATVRLLAETVKEYKKLDK